MKISQDSPLTDRTNRTNRSSNWLNQETENLKNEVMQLSKILEDINTKNQNS